MINHIIKYKIKYKINHMFMFMFTLQNKADAHGICGKNIVVSNS